jgi:hypothetical protein
MNLLDSEEKESQIVTLKLLAFVAVAVFFFKIVWFWIVVMRKVKVQSTDETKEELKRRIDIEKTVETFQVIDDVVVSAVELSETVAVVKHKAEDAAQQPDVDEESAECEAPVIDDKTSVKSFGHLFGHKVGGFDEILVVEDIEEA